ncbi:MAG TPA: hypothetical protein IAB10_06550 [Candidatus Avilachnospira avistercoris]|nr:hypothetical protein [Candidatus Avilachnospira avistercoris]
MKDKGFFDITNAKRALDIAMLVCIAVFAFYINRDIEIKGLYMDDLYMWSFYGEQSFFEFVFPIGGSVSFRPIYWMLAYIEMALVGPHVSWYLGFNVVSNIVVAYSLFYICYKVAHCRLLAFLSAISFLASRFAYYQIGQVVGLMETLALFLALWVLYFLYVYMNKKNDRTKAALIAEGEALLAKEAVSEVSETNAAAGPEASSDNTEAKVPSEKATESAGKEALQEDEETKRQNKGAFSALGLFKDNAEKPKLPSLELSIRLVRSYDIYYYGALILYVLLCLTHERFLSLLPLFYLVLIRKLLREEKSLRKAYLTENKRKWLAPVIAVAAMLLVRMIFTGGMVPAGTGGTEVTDTFSVMEALGFAIDQVKYLFGINAGQDYLSGLSWEGTPEFIKGLVKISILMIGVIIAMYAIVLLLYIGSKDKKDRAQLSRLVWDSALFIAFIGLCIGSSSVTIRVEMRWVYVSFAAELIFACYMIKAVGEAYRQSFGEPEPEAATGALSGNIFQRMSLTVADRLVGPKVFYGVLCLIFAAYCGLSIYTNIFYRGYFPNIYFWADQQRMNSLAEETIEKYGTDGVLGKDVYIIENSYGMSDFYARYFFKPYDKEKTAQGTRIYFVSGPEVISETALASGDVIVLEEVPEENAYRDISSELMPTD